HALASAADGRVCRTRRTAWAFRLEIGTAAGDTWTAGILRLRGCATAATARHDADEVIETFLFDAAEVLTPKANMILDSWGLLRPTFESRSYLEYIRAGEQHLRGRIRQHDVHTSQSDDFFRLRRKVLQRVRHPLAR